MCTKKSGLLLGMTGTILWILCLGLSVQAGEQAIKGTIGASSKWGSGWMVLAPYMDFSKGDKLRVTVGGSAKKVLVRLLPATESPDTSVGVIGGPIDVPNTRIVEVTLPESYKQIKQISVHGGPNPWDEYDLGGGNGPATIRAVELLKP